MGKTSKTLAGGILALALAGAGAAPAFAGHGGTTGKQPAPKAKAVDFAGTVALSNCSGSVVRSPKSKPDDPALVLTNGHCVESGFPAAGEVIVDQPSTRTFKLLDAKANDVATLTASKVSYATMTDTDVTIYQLTSSYRDITKKYGIKPLELSADHPVKGRAITVVSGYWKKTYSCDIDGFAYRLKEGEWTWKDSVRYTSACQTIGGTSGSPVIDHKTGKVAAINNTGNEDGERCTLNNPCEVDRKGNVTVRKDINYAQETYGIVPCVGKGSSIDLNRKGCKLPRPTAARR
ncbi:trypsin-like serine peptidase [Streptomyces kanamyceticus]|uniref:Serine protease n=1 Tax=Streptomyces kanamyceticus TaxID=1967 RepID=A0A5J6GE73_STRKN|nr:serine protease [Streptomyces kanamyceticus]QEU92145.1 serine protease [Streptomyces kanamyceticus]